MHTMHQPDFGMMVLLILPILVKFLEWLLLLLRRMSHNQLSLEYLECNRRLSDLTIGSEVALVNQ